MTLTEEVRNCLIPILAVTPWIFHTFCLRFVSSHVSGQDSQPASLELPSATSEAYLNDVESVRLPAFWRNNPNKLFTVMEAAFHLKLITQDLNKCSYVFVNLDKATLGSIADIL